MAGHIYGHFLPQHLRFSTAGSIILYYIIRYYINWPPRASNLLPQKSEMLFRGRLLIPSSLWEFTALNKTEYFIFFVSAVAGRLPVTGKLHFLNPYTAKLFLTYYLCKLITNVFFCALVKEKLASNSDNEIATTSLRVSLKCPVGFIICCTPAL